MRALFLEAVGEERDAVELRDGEFTVCYASDDVVVKLWPEPGTPLLTHERDLVHAEAEFCRRAAEVDFPAPRLLHLDTSRRLVGRDWLAMTRVPGKPLPRDGDGLDPGLERELGEALARLHRVTGPVFGYPGTPALQAPTWHEAFGRIVATVLDDAARFGAPLPFPPADALAAVERNAAALDEVTRPALVHFDAWAGNVIVSHGRLSGVIDGERALWADPLAEWATLAYGREPEDRPELLAGYGSLVLDEAARRRLDLYRLYLFLVILAEEVPRGYDPVWRAPTRARAERGAVDVLSRL